MLGTDTDWLLLLLASLMLVTSLLLRSDDEPPVFWSVCRVSPLLLLALLPNPALPLWLLLEPPRVIAENEELTD